MRRPLVVQTPRHAGDDDGWAAAIEDIRDDLTDMAALVADRMADLRRMEDEVHLCGDAAPPWVRAEVSDGVGWLIMRDSATAGDIDRCLSRAAGRPTKELMVRLTLARRRLAEEIRTRQAVFSGVMVAADWHSPSISHSVHSNAGRYDGKVAAYRDDYKRDRHRDESVWEQRWLDEMVDNPYGHPLRALMTASGMAAFTTVVAHVMGRAESGPILVGASTYHECRELLHQIGRPLIELPEGDLVAWRDAIRMSPSAVFVDSLCNASGLPVTDVAALARLLERSRAFLVVDNTARSVAMQPWTWMTSATPPRLIVFESLTKYAQLGLDRGAGGVIVTDAAQAEKLDDLREHLGTNIADAVVHQHPAPNRTLIERRLGRIGRNVGIIAETLQGRIEQSGIPVRISYPGLRTHPGFPVLADSGFHGGCMSIEPVDQDTIGFSRQLIKATMNIGAERDVPFCEGTSFGFDTTRLYLTASTTDHGTPFLRVAAGTEHRPGIEAVARVLADAVEITA